MASIALNYDSIYDAAKHAKKVASTAEDYVLKLQTKIINNIDSLSGVNTDYTTEAKMQVSKKMMHLYDKRDIYEGYGLKLEQFVEDEEYGAKAVDQRVVELFQSEGGFPKKKKKNKSVGSRVFTFLSNAVQTAGEFAYDVLLDISDVVNWVFQLPEKIDYWYAHQGGKYLIKAATSLFVTVVTIAGCVLCPVGALTLYVLDPLAILYVSDLPVSIYNNVRAYNEYQHGNVEMAEYYSNLDTVTKEIRANTNNEVAITITKGIDFAKFNLESIALVDAGFAIGEYTLSKIIGKYGKINVADEIKNSYNVMDDVDDIADDVVGKGGSSSRIKPSGNYDINAKPRGTVTTITDKMDDATKRSLMRENEAAETIARNGYDIEQNPVINETTRNPDYIIEEKVFDCYAPASNTKVRNVASTIEEKVIKKGQTNNVVLNLDDWNGNVEDLIKQLNDYPVEGLEEVIVVKDGKIISIYP